MPDFLIFTGLIPKLLGARLVLDMHDLMPEMYLSKYGERGSRFMVSLFKWIELRSVAFADRTIAVHKPHLDVLVEHGNPREKYSILMNVPDHRIFTRRPRRPRASEFRLLYHGTIPKRAGLETAIRAVAQIRNEIPNLQFDIVGRGEFVPALKTLIEELKVGDCVTVTPTVPIEQLPEVFSRADVGIVPYTADAFTRYVLPTKLMEYAATGLPAIVSRLPSVETYFTPEMVAYFEPGNAEDLAWQILRVYRDPSLADDLASQAAVFSAAYSWPQHREVYFRLIDSLTQSREVLTHNRKDEPWRKTTLS